MLDMKESPLTKQGLKALVKKPADLSEAKAKRWGLRGPCTGSRRVAQGPVGQRLSV